LAWPVVLTYLMTMGLQNVNLLFVGHLGKDELAGSALGLMYANVTGFSLVIGLLSALETLISQANGAENYKRIGLILQRGILITTVFCLPVVVAWFMCERILIFLKQDPKIAAYAGRYVSMYTLGLIPYIIFEATKRYLQMQNIMKPTIWVALIVNILNPVFLYLFIYVSGWGLIGAPIAMSCCYWLLAVLSVMYIRYFRLHEKTWSGFSKEIFKGWGEFIKLGFPGALMICLEWGSFEIVAIGLGVLHQSELLAAHTVLANTGALVFMIPLGIGIAASTRVGNFLGAGNPAAAKKTAFVAILFTICCTLATGLALFSVRKVYGRLYSNDDQVVSLVSSMIPQLAFGFIIFDATQGAAGGVLRGAGKQMFGAIVNLLAFYVVGLPVAFTSILVLHWGLRGTWLGLGLAEFGIATGYSIVILKTDWVKSSTLARAIASTGIEFQKLGTDEDTVEMKESTIGSDSVNVLEYVDEEPQEKSNGVQVALEDI